ncbi:MULTISPECIES: SAM-dependent methyltransferase [Streptomyces]|uniref:SAM-dependent methyltransferase n=1 Tax=Streptomyces TaxID=1883 RepID=UPI0029C015C2|nr:SAM-dependent methyltransferase [Streptomyces europaeiscabiei]
MISCTSCRGLICHSPDTILRAATATLDFEQPIAITTLGLLNFVMDNDEAVTVVRRLTDAVPSGGHLVISHPTTEIDGEAMTAAVDYWNGQGSAPKTLRSHADLARLFGDVELLDPSIVSCSRWRPETTDEDIDVTHFGGGGLKR